MVLAVLLELVSAGGGDALAGGGDDMAAGGGREVELLEEVEFDEVGEALVELDVAFTGEVLPAGGEGLVLLVAFCAWTALWEARANRTAARRARCID